MKGLEMSIINLVILVIALALITVVIWKLIPAFGSFVSNSLKLIKENLCKNIGIC
jgi:hypothetical protein